MQKTKIATSQLVIPGKDAAIMLDFVDKTFHQMPFPVQPFVKRTLGFVACGSLMMWNHWFHFLCHNPIIKILSRIARSAITYSKANPTIKGTACPMSASWPSVSAKRKGLPNPSTVRWILVLNPPRLRPKVCACWPPLFLCPSGKGMGTHDGAVDYPIFHIGVVSKMVQHPLPHSLGTPARKALVNAVPFPYSAGNSCQDEPQRLIHRTPSTKRRHSFSFLPI